MQTVRTVSLLHVVHVIVLCFPLRGRSIFRSRAHGGSGGGGGEGGGRGQTLARLTRWNPPERAY